MEPLWVGNGRPSHRYTVLKVTEGAKPRDRNKPTWWLRLRLKEHNKMVAMRIEFVEVTFSIHLRWSLEAKSFRATKLTRSKIAVGTHET